MSVATAVAHATARGHPLLSIIGYGRTLQSHQGGLMQLPYTYGLNKRDDGGAPTLICCVAMSHPSAI